mmetsp:Transcript_32593/g.56563  ORF Transcript_32593/g.56563 Transcript_32593/m.56563 type:complete len:87 (+) Transcript_32593:1342-1602(+)
MENCLRIDGLRRPLQVSALKELLGRTCDILYFWIDAFKTHCYIETTDPTQAERTATALHGITWPVETGQPLQVKFVSKSECRQHGD